MLLWSLLVASVVGVGCAEVITYSNKSVEQGQKLLAAGQTEQAAGAFRNATQQNPRNVKAYYLLGQSYQKLGREQQALQSFKTALAVRPKVDPTSRAPDAIAAVAFRDDLVNGLADCVAKAASKDAELSAMTAKATASNDAVDWYVVARTNAIVGDADAALDAYGKALAASNNNDRAIVKSNGLYLAQLGQRQQAEAMLTKAYQMKPDDAEINAALRGLGVVPGPSLLEPGQLHQPALPKGPLPELEINVRDQRKADAANEPMP